MKAALCAPQRSPVRRDPRAGPSRARTGREHPHLGPRRAGDHVATCAHIWPYLEEAYAIQADAYFCPFYGYKRSIPGDLDTSEKPTSPPSRPTDQGEPCAVRAYAVARTHRIVYPSLPAGARQGDTTPITEKPWWRALKKNRTRHTRTPITWWTERAEVATEGRLAETKRCAARNRLPKTKRAETPTEL